jgi:sialate O-acetylesterase
MNRTAFRISLILGSLSWARAEVALPAIFSDHMVLQRDARVPVWGTASAGEKVTVEFAGQKQSATAGADGRWKVAFANLKSNAAPQTLTVKASNTLVIQDVLVGEVWLGSGQSNMAFTVNRADNFEAEAAAAKFPLIRHFKEESTSAKTAQTEPKGKWVLCAPETVGGFSAALYFFGRELHQTLNVPIGLVHSSVGGTPIESWIAPEAQHASPELKSFFAGVEKENAESTNDAAMKRYDRALAKWQTDAKKAKAEKQKAPKKPLNPADVAARKADVGGLFNGKIAPLIPYAIRGMLWYQGEANSTPAKVGYYQYQLPLLIRDWRTRWGYEFPVAWAQLPNFKGPGRDWPMMREAMLKTLALPKTGMAITIDVGNPDNIHPTNKQAVGHRFALWALGEVYGQKVPATSGPLPAGHTVRGKEIVLGFKHANGGLVAKDGALTGFTIAGADRQWKPAQARIEGDKVVVSSSEVPAPVAARYAWENDPTCNLYNGAGLPASPFRTDDWK